MPTMDANIALELRREVLRGVEQAEGGNFAEESLDEIADAILSEET